MRTIKRRLIIVVIILVCALLFGCSNISDIYNDSKEIKIGVTIYKESDLFISTIVNNLEKMVKEKENEEDIKISLNIVDSNVSTLNEVKQVEKFINQQYDVICVNLVDRTVASTIIDKAKASNIPVIFFNREPVEEDMQRWDKVYYVGTESKESGRMQAEIILNEYENEGITVDKNGDGKIQYVMLEGEPGHQDTSIRTEYCIKTIIDNGLEVEKLADDIANWESAQANDKMIQWIKKYYDNIEVVFSNNDDMALGAVLAYDTLGIDVEDRPLIVGVDGISEALEAIKNGFMSGSVISDSSEQAKAIIDMAYALSKEDDLDILKKKYIRIKHTKVTKENVELFLK